MPFRIRTGGEHRQIYAARRIRTGKYRGPRAFLGRRNNSAGECFKLAHVRSFCPVELFFSI